MNGPAQLLARLREAAPHRVRLAASMLYRGRDRARLARMKELAPRRECTADRGQ